MSDPVSKFEANETDGFVRLEHLKEGAWIGFGAAVEWIAARGEPIPFDNATRGSMMA